MTFMEAPLFLNPQGGKWDWKEDLTLGSICAADLSAEKGGGRAPEKDFRRLPLIVWCREDFPSPDFQAPF